MSTLGHGVFRGGSTPQDLMYRPSSGGSSWQTMEMPQSSWQTMEMPQSSMQTMELPQSGGGQNAPWSPLPSPPPTPENNTHLYPETGLQPLTPSGGGAGAPPSGGAGMVYPESGLQPLTPSGGGGGRPPGGGSGGMLFPESGLQPLTPSGDSSGSQSAGWASPSWRVGGGDTQTGGDAPYWSSGKIFQPMTMDPNLGGVGTYVPPAGSGEGLGNPATGGWNTPPSGEALGNPATGGWGGSSGGMNVPQLGGVKV